VAWRVLLNGLAELSCGRALPRQPPLGAGVAGVNRKSDSKKCERLALYISAQKPIFAVENDPEN